jgi:molecular chaperone GrpE (heat shock protein)
MENPQILKEEDPATLLPAEPEAQELLLQKLIAIESLLIQDLSVAKDSLTLRDKSIARLQEVVYEHEKRMFSNIEEGLLRELCLYKDKLDQVANRFAEASKTITTDFQYVCEEFDDLLYGLGVNTIESSEPSYDRATQKVKAHIPTNDPSKHQMVAEVLKPGYSTQSKVLRKQDVSIYTYQKPIGNE